MWLVALGIGAPAAMQAQSDHKPPGCYLAHDYTLIAKSRHSYILQDPTMNLLISSVSITSGESVRHHGSSRMSHRSGYVHHNQTPVGHHASNSVRPPSVASSV